jgi:Heterokaryon incompatibility protein (HET)
LITTCAGRAGKSFYLPDFLTCKLFKELCVTYLWIDSLCIIQGDETDWATEAAAMAEIYGGSLCTLHALKSPDSHGGLGINIDVKNFGSYVT